MFEFFYDFFKKPLLAGLFYRSYGQGNPPSPPGFSFLTNSAGDPLVNNEQVYLVGSD